MAMPGWAAPKWARACVTMPSRTENTAPPATSVLAKPRAPKAPRKPENPSPETATPSADLSEPLQTLNQRHKGSRIKKWLAGLLPMLLTFLGRQWPKVVAACVYFLVLLVLTIVTLNSARDRNQHEFVTNPPIDTSL